jgi:hypothetical protein
MRSFINWNQPIKENEMGRACNTYGEKRHAYRILSRMLEGRRPLRRFRRQWKNNINLDLREIR